MLPGPPPNAKSCINYWDVLSYLQNFQVFHNIILIIDYGNDIQNVLIKINSAVNYIPKQICKFTFISKNIGTRKHFYTYCVSPRRTSTSRRNTVNIKGFTNRQTKCSSLIETWGEISVFERINDENNPENEILPIVDLHCRRKGQG